MPPAAYFLSHWSGQFLGGEEHEDAFDDREKFSLQNRGGLPEQLTDLREEVVEEPGMGYRLASQPPCEYGQRRQSFKRETSTVPDPRPHDVGNSRVESTMEMRLSHFIDPAHQGGHPHRSFFGNGKL